MNLYRISQTANCDYDTYDSAVVVAENAEEAQNMNPSDGHQLSKEYWNDPFSTWTTTLKDVKVVYLGKADKSLDKGVVCASFNAG